MHTLRNDQVTIKNNGIRIMKKYIIIILLLAVSSVSFAVDFRGRVDARTPEGLLYPFADKEINLYNSEGIIITTTHTGTYGFFFFYGIDPGEYTIRINKNKDVKITIPDVPWHDVLPIWYDL